MKGAAQEHLGPSTADWAHQAAGLDAAERLVEAASCYECVCLLGGLSAPQATNFLLICFYLWDHGIGASQGLTEAEEWAYWTRAGYLIKAGRRCLPADSEFHFWARYTLSIWGDEPYLSYEECRVMAEGLDGLAPYAFLYQHDQHHRDVDSLDYRDQIDDLRASIEGVNDARAREIRHLLR